MKTDNKYCAFQTKNRQIKVQILKKYEHICDGYIAYSEYVSEKNRHLDNGYLLLDRNRLWFRDNYTRPAGRAEKPPKVSLKEFLSYLKKYDKNK